MNTKLEIERQHFESIFEDIESNTLDDVFDELSAYNWSNKVTRQAFFGALEFGLSSKCLKRCHAAVSLIVLLRDLPDFQPIIDKYRQKLREDTEILLTGTNDINSVHFILHKYSETIFLLVRSGLVTEKMTCEFLTRLITPPKRGKHIACVRLFVAARILSRLPVDFPEANRKEWIPKFIEQMNKFYEVEKNRYEAVDIAEVFDDNSFEILYENLIKGLERQLEIEGDEPSKDDTIDINTIRCKTFLLFFRKNQESLDELLNKTSMDLEQCKEKLENVEVEIMESHKKLKEMNEASKKNKRIEMNVRKLRRDSDRILKDISDLLMLETRIERKKEKLDEMEKVTRKDLTDADLPWICFNQTQDLNEPSTSAN